MDVKKSLVTALSLISFAILANPAPVADLSRSSNKTFGAQNSARAGSVEERLAALERVVEARASAQLEMQQQLQTLLDEVSELRGTIMAHLRDVQQAADQQLTSARLRAEVSALAQTKLTAKLNRRT